MIIFSPRCLQIIVGKRQSEIKSKDIAIQQEPNYKLLNCQCTNPLSGMAGLSMSVLFPVSSNFLSKHGSDAHKLLHFTCNNVIRTQARAIGL